MASNFEDFLEATQAVASPSDLGALFQASVVDEGYQNIVFAHLPHKTEVCIIAKEFPSGYTEQYFGNKFNLIDPILQQTIIAKQPFLWDTIAHNRPLTQCQRAFFDDCKDMGVHSGLTMPFHNPDGSTHIVSVSLRDGPKPDPRRVPFIYALAAQTWIRHSALLSSELECEERKIQLTGRERECLSWAKDGKTNWEISQIISVAERTVEFHIGNAMRKLDASNRITAIVIAIQEGIIGL